MFSFSPSAIAIAPQSSIEFPVVKNENKLDKKGRKESYIFVCIYASNVKASEGIVSLYSFSDDFSSFIAKFVAYKKKEKIYEREREREDH